MAALRGAKINRDITGEGRGAEGTGGDREGSGTRRRRGKRQRRGEEGGKGETDEGGGEGVDDVKEVEGVGRKNEEKERAQTTKGFGRRKRSGSRSIRGGERSRR